MRKNALVSEGTIKNHRKNIYRKLKIKSQAELFCKFLP
ncbi:LuxR C-terminal-related transcriptional regulator [Marinomonas rhodophyticola]